MCKVVYLTVKRFDKSAGRFASALASALRERRIEVVEQYSYDAFNLCKRHKTYGIALAFDFYHDAQSGSGLTLNKNCSTIGRDFAYELCNAIDAIAPEMTWRDFRFVDSDDREWYRFFNKVSSTTKAVFHICNDRIERDRDIYNTHFDTLVAVFAEEIVRCLRSDYNAEQYRRRVRVMKGRINSLREKQINQ